MIYLILAASILASIFYIGHYLQAKVQHEKKMMLTELSDLDSPPGMVSSVSPAQSISYGEAVSNSPLVPGDSPVNALPTDKEIQASIQAQNAQNLSSGDRIRERDLKVQAVTDKIASLSKQQLSPTTPPPKPTPHQKPPQALVQKVKSGEYAW